MLFLFLFGITTDEKMFFLALLRPTPWFYKRKPTL
ncbi:hypothetical protein FHW74_002094 [Atlantibacter sp. RC6]|nr:hypothetical protein [Atlantibacter sp. RC6]